MPDPTVVRSVRLPRDLMDRLTALADTEQRTVNNLVIKLLTDAVDSADATTSSKGLK